MTTLEDRYKALNKLINSALLAFHPDHNRSEIAPSMTRGLLDAKQRARRVYSRLTDAERAQIAEDLKREG